MKPETTIPKTPFRFLFWVSSMFKGYALGAIVVVIIATVLSQSTSYFFKFIIDSAASGDKRAVLTYALLYPLSIGFVQVLYRLSGYLGMLWTTRVNKFSNDTLTQYLFRHGHQYFSDRFAGSLLSKVGNVVGATDQFIPDFLWSHLSALVSFIVTATIIFLYDVRSGCLFVFLAIVLIVVNMILSKRKRELSYRASEVGTKLRGVIVDILSNMSATRQYVQTQREIDRVKDVSTERMHASHANWAYTELTLLLNVFLLCVFSLGIFYFLSLRWVNGEITTGDFALVLALFAQITGALIFIGRAISSTARVIGELEEGLEEILRPYDIVDTSGALSLAVSRGEIVWDNVTFEFAENRVFDNFNLTIKPGERVGLVGSSGAGKSTFVSLLLRQHDVQGGRILIDDQNIATVTQDSLREHIAVVPQEPLLFHRSIRENIAYGKPDATDEEIEEVAQKAQAHDFIKILPQGYDTLVGERGVKLSGGQRQRIAIARAMLKNAPILVLDEATSALDSESEVAIQTALHELMEGKTVIAIAHRLSTLREMDRIIVLEKGQIIEDGTHASLLEEGGVYANLWSHQAGGFLRDEEGSDS